MRAYVTTTGVLFGLLALVHIGRAVVEGGSMLRDPFYVSMTVVSAVLAIWAWRVRATIPRA